MTTHGVPTHSHSGGPMTSTTTPTDWHGAACAWQAGFTQGTGGAARLVAQQEG